MDRAVEVDVDIDWYFGCVKRVSKPIQVLFNAIAAVTVLTLIVLKQRALVDGLTDVGILARGVPTYNGGFYVK